MKHEDAILAANAAYYEAFAARDLALMGEIWGRECVSCIHPGWPSLIGRDAVLGSYREILRNPQQETIEIRDAVALADGEEARVLCTEIVGSAALAATNVFRLRDGAWRLVHHQASPIVIAAQPGRTSLH